MPRVRPIRGRQCAHGHLHQLRNIDDAFRVIAGFPEFKNKPIVIGESDPDGCAACQGPQLGYRNGTLFSSYTAASFARKYDLADRHGVLLEGALTWAFTFETSRISPASGNWPATASACRS
jgi:xylan 1,4-beta-xylosidase